jgi:hypothetical protein
MDIGYNPHAERTRRKNRSSTNLSHLSLAPLTVKLPLNDDEAIPDSAISPGHQTTSYLQGKSAPTTPRLLSRSPIGPRSRSHHRTPSAPGGPITKSKSSSHLVGARSKSMATGGMTPRRRRDEGLTANDAMDSDWLLRTGALMTSEAREYKGQAWLVSRQSSTSLAGVRDAEDVAFEEELAREREMASRLTSRRGSSAHADDDASPHVSRFASRSNSRSRSHPELRSNLLTPLDRPGDDSYFSGQEPISGPDFVNLDEKLEELERDTSRDDEAAVRRLVKRGQAGTGSWISNVIGWSLFSVDEHEEDSEDGEDESLEGSVTQHGRSEWPDRHFEGVSNVPDERLPPPKADQGGWQDAAWLLSVASKVMF